LLAALTGTIHAAPPAPQTPPHPPLPPPGAASGQETADTPPLTSLALPPLKAILLVGPIDGDDGSWTTAEKRNMELAAQELEANGVEVYRFYTPNTSWERVKAAAEGAHFFFYRGDGVYWSPMPSPTVGGLALKNEFVSPDAIRRDLRLAPNAIVMMYACFSAGTASNDTGSISSQEAQRRVAQYSDPFFDVGASAYFANWYGNAFQMFVRYLFQGKTLGQAYEAYSDFNRSSVERYSHPNHPGMAMWLDKDFWDGKTQYNHAFAGLPNHTLADLFLGGALRLAPTHITQFAEPSFPPRTHTIDVYTFDPAGLTWSASVTPAGLSWIEVYPSHGNGDEPIHVVVKPTGRQPGTYQATIRVTTDHPQAQDEEYDIPATLHILNRVYSTHLPLTIR
jgi:hypothetical protein